MSLLSFGPVQFVLVVLEYVLQTHINILMEIYVPNNLYQYKCPCSQVHTFSSWLLVTI